MIINALHEYYELLKEAGEDIPLLGYSRQNISFALVISEEGDLRHCIDLRNQEKRGKTNKLVALPMIVPEQKVRSGKNPPPYFLCENSKYILGFDAKRDKDTKEKEIILTPERFEDFKGFQNSIIQGIDSKSAKAVINFLDKWDVDKVQEHPAIKEQLTDLAGCWLVFKLESQQGYLHENKDIQQSWEKYCQSSENERVGQCLVTGENALIARIHGKIKNIRGAQAAGASLVGFNFRSVESYGKNTMQAYNSPVSEYVAFTYSSILNQMLVNPKQKIQIGDATTVFWAKSPKKAYIDLAAELMGSMGDNPEEANKYEENHKTKELMASILKNIREGKKVKSIPSDVDEETDFYILGLSPNNARVAVRFFVVNTFGKFLDNITMHYQDMSIIKQWETDPNDISFWRILNETVMKNAKDKKVSPILSGGLIRAATQGGVYPSQLYHAIMGRIRADKEINYVRAAVIKAYLVRQARINNKAETGEVLTVALNEASNNRSYTLGRLFAVLEKAQEDAAGRGLNTTIKDRYFTSACATPSAIFPTLIKLSQHHIAKSDYGYISDRRITELLGKVDGFPQTQSLEEQGLFILGYYQQKPTFYQKKEDNQ